MQYDLMTTRKRKIFKRIHIKRLAFIFLVVYGIVTIVKVVMTQEEMFAKQANDAVVLKQQIEQVQTENLELENKLRFADTPQYIERIARDQLGYIKKEGEIKIVEQK